MKKYKYSPIKLFTPDFDSPLVTKIMKLESYKVEFNRVPFDGEKTITHPFIFKNLKEIFHMLDSLGSAQIEGNNTTLADYINHKLDKEKRTTEDKINEIENIEKAISFVKNNVAKGDKLSEELILELHKLTVQGLFNEDAIGKFRTGDVCVRNSNLVFPPSEDIPDLIKELLDFWNKKDKPRFQWIKLAIFLHRYVWIHPFFDGNGRSSRLLTHALLQSLGMDADYIVNPNGIFCQDRNFYYEMLKLADTGTEEGILKWCDYVLGGIIQDTERLEKLLNFTFVKEKITRPAIKRAINSNELGSEFNNILAFIYNNNLGEFKTKDVKHVLNPLISASARSNWIKRMIDKDLLKKEKSSYSINMFNTYILRRVIDELRAEDFIPKVLDTGNQWPIGKEPST